VYSNEGGVNMSNAKEKLLKMIKEIPENEIAKILDFAELLRVKYEKRLYNDLSKVSESSLEFWDNEIDDEVWNDV
jgi:hypothetical protein